MEIKVTAILFDKVVKRAIIKVNEDRAKKVIAKLKQVNTQIVDKLKQFKKNGEIGSLFKPRNREIQEYLDDLILAKKQIKQSITKISEIFLR